MAKARVRGVYSTCLTKLLLDHGFEIVQPSVSIRERFGIEERSGAPDLDVRERCDRQGVHALGRAESINSFKSMLQSNLHDVIIREWPVAANGIYKGIVETERLGSFLVNIGSAIGRISKEDISNPDVKEVVVQVERRRVGARRPALTTEVKIPGKYAILVPQREIKISRKIRDREDRSRLLKLGEGLAPQDWGIIWRTAAKNQPPQKLEDEIDRLVKEGEVVLEKAEEAVAPAELWEGSHFLDVEFPALSKKRLDGIRRSVTETMEGHHYYKACGGDFAVAVDMAERLLEKGGPMEEVEKLFRQTVEAGFPTVGSVIDIEHVKLDGRVLHLGEAKVETFDETESLIEFSRVVRGEGTYDGLRTSREAGDRAVTEAKIGEWHYKTQYFSKEGRHKGTYINLNTPIELYPYGIRYVDLEVDVCVWPSGKVGVVDEKKLESAAIEGVVTKRLVETVKKKVQRLMKAL
ncbi:MAG: ribonuclease E/G [Candidatus Bathyarchaeia archaeon]